MVTWTWEWVQQMFDHIMGKHEPIAVRIREWSGRAVDFETQVAGPVDSAVGTAIGAGTATALYVAWSAVVEVDRRERKRGNRGIRRGLALDLWDRVDERRGELSNLVQWGHSEAVLLGTIHSCWEGLLKLLKQPPGSEGVWLNAVNAAVRNATDQLGRAHENDGRPPDTSAVENLMALLDLGARVFGAGRSGGDVPDRLKAWRHVMIEEAAKLATYAECREARPFGLRGSEEVNDNNDNNDNLARFFLCVYADSVKPIPSSDPVGALAARVVSESDGPTESTEDRATEVELLLRHFAFQHELFAVVLQERVGYRPFGYRGAPRRRLPNVAFLDGLDRLDQKVLVLGPTDVGKSSFFFASEALCSKLNAYSPFTIEHARPNYLEEIRQQWKRGKPTRTEGFEMTARVNLSGFCSFDFVDPPGESVMGPRARRDGDRSGHLRAHIARLRPSSLLLMLSPELSEGDGTGGVADRSDVIQGLERALRYLTELEYLANPEHREAFPVYLVMNKTDLLFDEYRNRGGDEGRLGKLSEQLRKGAFRLYDYLAASGNARGGGGDVGRTENADAAAVLSNLSDDPTLAEDVAVRKLVGRVLRDWRGLVEPLGREGFWNATLVFTCGHAMGASQSGMMDQLGVSAFWERFSSQDMTGLFAPGLKKYAARVFVDDLKDNLRAVEGLMDPLCGLHLGEEPKIDKEALGTALKRLPTMARRVVHEGTGSGDFANKIRSSPTYEGMMDIANRYGLEVKGLSELGEGERIGTLIGELNVAPGRGCGEFLKTDESHEDELKWRMDAVGAGTEWVSTAMAATSGRHEEVADAGAGGTEGVRESVGDSKDSRIRQKIVATLRACQNHLVDGNVAKPEADCAVGDWKRYRGNEWHPYFGAMRGSAICRNEEEAILFPEVEKWLEDGGRVSLVERVKTFLSRELAENRRDTLPEEVADVLWFVSDHGGERQAARRVDDERQERRAGYERLAVRRNETDRFLVRALGVLERERSDRVGEVVELFGRLFSVLRKAGRGAPVREALRGFVYAHVLAEMGFDVDALRKDEETTVSLRVAQAKLSKLVAEADEEGGFFKRGRDYTEEAGDVVDGLAALLAAPVVSESRPTSEPPRMRDLAGHPVGEGKVRQMLARVSFALDAVREELVRGSLLSVESAQMHEVNGLEVGLGGAVRHFNAGVEEYVKNTRKLLLAVHYQYLDQGGFLKGQAFLSDRLNAEIGQVFDPVTGKAGGKTTKEIVDGGFKRIVVALA